MLYDIDTQDDTDFTNACDDCGTFAREKGSDYCRPCNVQAA
jgi:hypothetical protein